jgi:hypothetical protein
LWLSAKPECRNRKTDKEIDISASLETSMATAINSTDEVLGRNSSDRSNSGPTSSSSGEGALERFTYDDAVVRWFMGASVVWGIVGMLVGISVFVSEHAA